MKTFQELFEPKPQGEKKFYKIHDPKLKVVVDPKVDKANNDEFDASNVKTFDRQKYRFGAKPEQDANGQFCDEQEELDEMRKQRLNAVSSKKILDAYRAKVQSDDEKHLKKHGSDWNRKHYPEKK